MHWLPMMMGESRSRTAFRTMSAWAWLGPKDWFYFVQPGALKPVKDETGKIVDFEPNPEAENILNNATAG
jgi:hypothetical protein